MVFNVSHAVFNVSHAVFNVSHAVFNVSHAYIVLSRLYAFPDHKYQTSRLNPLSFMPILGSSNSAAKKDMMSKIWTIRDTIIRLSRKHC